MSEMKMPQEAPPNFENFDRFTFFLKGPFSQWHPSNFEVAGRHFINAEQYMMLAKAEMFGDHAIAEKIVTATDPADHKRLGRAVRGFDQDAWDRAKVTIVHQGNRAKFEQNSGLRKRLMRTAGTLLVEVNPHDQVWGIGLAESDPAHNDRRSWRGENLLGRILTQIREGITSE